MTIMHSVGNCPGVCGRVCGFTVTGVMNKITLICVDTCVCKNTIEVHRNRTTATQVTPTSEAITTEPQQTTTTTIATTTTTPAATNTKNNKMDNRVNNPKNNNTDNINKKQQQQRQQRQ